MVMAGVPTAESKICKRNMITVCVEAERGGGDDTATSVCGTTSMADLTFEQVFGTSCVVAKSNIYPALKRKKTIWKRKNLLNPLNFHAVMYIILYLVYRNTLVPMSLSYFSLQHST